MEYLTLGKIVGSFSLDGSIKIFSSTTNQKIRYKKGNKIFLYNPSENTYKELTVVKYRQNGLFDIVKVEEINVKEDADSLKGYEIHVLKDTRDLNEGTYFYSDLVGCLIVDENHEYGKVINVEEFPAQITLRCLTKDNKNFFVPFIKVFIDSVDIENKKIHIHYMEGLI